MEINKVIIIFKINICVIYTPCRKLVVEIFVKQISFLESLAYTSFLCTWVGMRDVLEVLLTHDQNFLVRSFGLELSLRLALIFDFTKHFNFFLQLKNSYNGRGFYHSYTAFLSVLF